MAVCLLALFLLVLLNYNSKEDYHFMLLSTGKQLVQRQWTAAPIPDAIIAAVEARAQDEKQPLIEGGFPRFESHPNIPMQHNDMNTIGAVVLLAQNDQCIQLDALSLLANIDGYV